MIRNDKRRGLNKTVDLLLSSLFYFSCCLFFLSDSLFCLETFFPFCFDFFAFLRKYLFFQSYTSTLIITSRSIHFIEKNILGYARTPSKSLLFFLPLVPEHEEDLVVTGDQLYEHNFERSHIFFAVIFTAFYFPRAYPYTRITDYSYTE